MGLAQNTKQLVDAAAATQVAERTAVEYHFLSWRELYDKSIITADRYSSGAAEWVLRGDRHFYTVTVASRPYYELPQELCVFFDCFTETKSIAHGTSIGPPIEQVAIEFITLLSALTREPLLPLGPRRVADRPVADRCHYIPPPRANRTTPPPAAAVDPVEMVSIVKGLARSGADTVNAALAASKLYHAALSLVGFDPSGAYVSLVSAIECLAGHQYKERKFDFNEIKKFEAVRAILGELAATTSNDDVVNRLRRELIRSEFFSYQKFKLFIVEHLPNEFWTTQDELYPYNSAFPAIIQDNLSWCLRRIYDRRSSYVHSGTPFPAYIEFGLRDRHPVDVSMEMLELIGKDKYLPSFSWFERVTHMVLREYLRRAFAPDLVEVRKEKLEEKERLITMISNLNESVRNSLQRLTQWTAQFLGCAIIGPHAPNKNWADKAETVKILLGEGLIGCDGEGLEGTAWLKDREVGEAVGEFFFGAKTNPFRRNELLLPKNWDDPPAGNGVRTES
jgi:hypothetical protein